MATYFHRYSKRFHRMKKNGCDNAGFIVDYHVRSSVCSIRKIRCLLKGRREWHVFLLCFYHSVGVFFFFYYHVWLCLSCNLFFSLVIALHLFSTTQHSIQPRSMANAGNIEAFNVKYKVLLLGDTLVGKTSLQRFMAGRDFRPDIGSTIGKNEIFCLWRTLDISVGVDFVNKIIPIERAKVNLQIWWRENVWELFAWIIESV